MWCLQGQGMNDNGASQSSVGLRKGQLHEEMGRGPGLRSINWGLKQQKQIKGLETLVSGICGLRRSKDLWISGNEHLEFGNEDNGNTVFRKSGKKINHAQDWGFNKMY